MSNDFREAAREIRRHAEDDLKNALKAKQDVGMKDLERETEYNTVVFDINASGELRENIEYDRFGRQRAGFFYTSAVRVTTDYAKFVDLGTGAKGVSFNGYSYPSPSTKPPLEPIIAWIVDKGITPIEFDTVYGLADAIARSIEVSGTAPKPFFRQAIFTTKPAIKREMEDAGSLAGRRTHRRI